MAHRDSLPNEGDAMKLNKQFTATLQMSPKRPGDRVRVMLEERLERGGD
jgi:hypothetical protein